MVTAVQTNQGSCTLDKLPSQVVRQITEQVVTQLVDADDCFLACVAVERFAGSKGAFFVTFTVINVDDDVLDEAA